MGNFNGYYQNDETRVVDSGGDELAIGASGEITAVVSGEVEISNDSGNPLPVSGNLTTSPQAISPLGYEQITVGGTPESLTVPVGADLAIIQNEGGTGADGVRWRDDGVSPTASVGMRLERGAQFEYGADLAAIEFINIAGGDDTLNVSYYEYV